jgi:MoaA/NifB/PqqE/SkfB family radical SAM enzyme
MQFIIYNYNFKKIAYYFWKSNWFNNNFIFKLFLNKQITKKINQYQDKPFCVRIENTNICNAHCVMCPRDKMKRGQGVMNMETYSKIIEQCLELGVNYINLHKYGEPLVDNLLPQRVAEAKRRGIKRITTNTNASLLTPEMSQKLIESGLDELFVSIDAINSHTYEKVRLGLNYERVVDNLLKFIEIKNNLKAKTKLIVSFVQSPENIKEVKGFIDFWKAKADHVSISYAHDWVGAKNNLIVRKRLDWPCRLLFSDLTIAWNGDYLLCCADYDAQAALGNIKDFSLGVFWKNNDKLRLYREKHLNHQAKDLLLCKDCTMDTIWWF